MKNEKRFYQSSSDERYTYTKYQELEYGIADNETDKVLGGEEILDLLNFLIKENEQLRENLHNCRLNKNIISEKLRLWQDVHKEYDIYNIKDFEELMKKVK